MGLGPIPWTAIDQYCNSTGIEGEQRDDFFYHVKKLDESYLKYEKKKQDKESQKAKRAGKAPRRR